MEREKYNRKQEKIAKVFKAAISSGLVTPVFISAASCAKEQPTAVEETENEPQQTIPVEVQSETITEEQSPPEDLSVEEEKKEGFPLLPISEGEQKEFTTEMIKNRLIFSNTILASEFLMKPGEPVPLWFVEDFGEEFFTVSGVVAGPLRIDVGDTGEEELLLPLAFQNPETDEIYIRDVSFGNSDYFSLRESYGGFSTTFLDNYSYENSNITFRSAKFEEIMSSFKIGDQFAFDLNLGEPHLGSIDKDSEEGKIVNNLFDIYVPNNIAIYEAMKENRELPDLKMSAINNMMVNKPENNK
jgi:hypothetical protein